MEEQSILIPVLMGLVVTTLLFITQIVRRWRWRSIWGFRKGNELDITGTRNYNGHFKIKKARKKTKNRVQEEPHPMEERPEDTYGAFPKIASEAVVKQCTLKKGGPDIRFDDLSISKNQAGILSGLIEHGDRVMLTIECVQGELPFEED